MTNGNTILSHRGIAYRPVFSPAIPAQPDPKRKGVEMTTRGAKGKCSKTGIGSVEGRKRAHERARNRKRQEKKIWTLDGRRVKSIVATRKLSPATSTAGENRPPWIGMLNGMIVASSISAFSRGPNSTRHRTVVSRTERADGDFLKTHKCTILNAKEPAVDFKDRASSSPPPFPPNRTEIITTGSQRRIAELDRREDHALKRIELHVYDLETAEDLIRHSLGDRFGDGESSLRDFIDGENKYSTFSADAEKDTVRGCETRSSESHDTFKIIDITLDESARERIFQQTEALLIHRCERMESLTRSGLSTVDLIESAVQTIIATEIQYLAREVESALKESSESICLNV